MDNAKLRKWCDVYLDFYFIEIAVLYGEIPIWGTCILSFPVFKVQFLWSWSNLHIPDIIFSLIYLQVVYETSLPTF